ncbi:hypothetical protein FHX41_2485 [Actinomadura hallensis]|uniref:Uncharacterized protein n=1 Tax=Actinomadura hallensis TaxID=337895 RepID=A0A543IE03_9ACTN|nr:hypothetical protein FHX41_2485 [Actinomadura hallensis]
MVYLLLREPASRSVAAIMVAADTLAPAGHLALRDQRGVGAG